MVDADCLARVREFLSEIGIATRVEPIHVATLFPGVLVSGGTLVIDEARLVAIGDVLHEAAHIALAPPSRRGEDAAFLDNATGGEEITTIAWCWAALLRLGIPPGEVFHGNAYKRGDSPAIIEAGERGVYIGFPLLQLWNMAFDAERAHAAGVAPFPHMVRWLRDAD